MESQLKEFGFQIIGISADRPSKVSESIKKHSLTFQLLSDSKMSAAESFGIAYRVDRATLQLLLDAGIDLEEASGETHHELPVPAVFLINAKGFIEFEYLHPDYSVRMHPEILLAAAHVFRK